MPETAVMGNSLSALYRDTFGGEPAPANSGRRVEDGSVSECLQVWICLLIRAPACVVKQNLVLIHASLVLLEDLSIHLLLFSPLFLVLFFGGFCQLQRRRQPPAQEAAADVPQQPSSGPPSAPPRSRC